MNIAPTDSDTCFSYIIVFNVIMGKSHKERLSETNTQFTWIFAWLYTSIRIPREYLDIHLYRFSALILTFFN